MRTFMTLETNRNVQVSGTRSVRSSVCVYCFVLRGISGHICLALQHPHGDVIMGHGSRTGESQ
jgi:hypothetical protein